MEKRKHYNTLNEYYQKKWKCKVAKIALNASFTCPNRDGTKGWCGCTYCSKQGSGDTAGNPLYTLQEQYLEIKAKIVHKWPNALFIPYLQAYSNTYAPLERLKEIYEGILMLDPTHIVALAIATRPDCFTNELYDYLGELNQRKPVIIELGLQTANELTAKIINRCCTNEELIFCVKELRKRRIEVILHIINGLPNETKEDMINTIDFINQLDIQGIKFHSLLLLKDTVLYQNYLKEPFPILSLEEYCSIVVQQIARLKPNIIIHRLSADGIAEDIMLPKWPMKKLVVMNEIDKLCKKLNIYQGDKFK